MQISEADKNNKFSIFSLGFRIFFLAAAIFSVVTIVFWAVVYLFKFSLPLDNISIFQWHAHEMIYGYSVAVIAGFLLTAVKNWTGVPTLHGLPLMLLFGLWLLARILFLFGTSYLAFAAVADISFLVFLLIAISIPIIKVKQWGQGTILAIVIMLMIFNVVFFLGAFDLLKQGVQLGIYAGIYLVLGLILIMGRRVVPFFIQRGVPYEVTLFNSKIIDICIVVFFLLFFITELFVGNQLVSSALALILFVFNIVRLAGWHTKGIWQSSMLWSLYLAFCFICLGFLLFGLVHFTSVSKYLAIHAFTVGGVGLITLSMMARVALGHTGRNVSKPPKVLPYALMILIIGVVFRVFIPLLDSSLYSVWVVISQVCWVMAFLLFVIAYVPILSKPNLQS